MTDQTNIVPVSETEKIIAIDKQALLAAADALVITNQQEMTAAGDIVKAIKTLGKKAEAERTSITKPLNEALRHVNARFKTITDPLDKADADVRKKMLGFSQAEHKRRADEEAANVAAAKELARKMDEEKKALPMVADPVGAQAPAPAAPPPPPTLPLPQRTHYGAASTTTVKQVWTAEVDDIVALATFYPHLVQANMVEINKLIQSGERNVPGLRIFQKEQIAVR